MQELMVKKIGIATLAYIYAFGFGTVGFFLGLAYAFESAIGFGQSTQSVLAGLAFGLTAGLLSIIFETVIYALIGLVVGFINAVIINYVLMGTQGLSITVDKQ